MPGSVWRREAAVVDLTARLLDLSSLRLPASRTLKPRHDACRDHLEAGKE